MTDLCECEQERAAILEHDAKMPREEAEDLVRHARESVGVWARCDSCTREEE